MSDANAALQSLLDRQAIEEVLYKYSSAVDSFDNAGVRSTLADDIWAHYGIGEPVDERRRTRQWISEATSTVIWQHHLLNIYPVDIDGDSAKAISYLTSYQVFKENPDGAIILVARYHDELKRTAGEWKLSRRIMEVLWGESRPKDGFLETIGGRGRRSGRATDAPTILPDPLPEENTDGKSPHDGDDDDGQQEP